MRLGINVPNFGPATTPASLRSWIEFAEEGRLPRYSCDRRRNDPSVCRLGPVPFAVVVDADPTLSGRHVHDCLLALGSLPPVASSLGLFEMIELLEAVHSPGSAPWRTRFVFRDVPGHVNRRP